MGLKVVEVEVPEPKLHYSHSIDFGTFPIFRPFGTRLDSNDENL